MKAILLSFTAVALCIGLDARAEERADGTAVNRTPVEQIVVTARPIKDYVAVDTLTGTKVGAELRDLPLSVSVVPQQLIQDRALTYLGEALDNVPGAQRKLGYGGTQNFGAYLRGFDSSFLTLRNGLRDYGFYTLRDTANVERFEVLKGPGSILYGAVYPGGITNTITKQPLASPYARIQASAGSRDRYRAEADLGGPLASTLFYRLNVAAEDADSFRDIVHNKGVFAAPVVSWVMDDRTNLTLELEYKHSDFTWDLGLPRNPVIFQVPVSRFLGEPSTNKVDSTYVTSTFEHRFGDTLKFRQTVGYARTSGDYELRSPLRVLADNRTVTRAAYDTHEGSETYDIQHDLIGEFDILGLNHQVDVGVDHYHTRQSDYFLFRPIGNIDLFNPVYGGTIGAGFPLFADRAPTTATGIYAQDLISLGDHIKLLVGARQDWVHNKAYDALAGTLSRSKRDHAFSPQGGVVYQPGESTSLYVSYGESFLPITSGQTSSGRYLDPESGRQVEAGVKQTWLDGRLSGTLAVYRITRNNVSTADPANPVFRVQTGQQRSKGVEVDLAGSPLPGWDVSIDGSYIDAYLSRDNVFRVGSELPGAAKWSGGLWSKYTIQNGVAKNLAAAVGVYYVDDRKTALQNAPTAAVPVPAAVFQVPHYTRLDAMLAYPFDRLTAQLNVRNLANKRIYDLTSTSVLPQEPRSFSLRLSYRF